MDALRLMSGTPTRNYEEIERLLSCPICLEVFSKPVVILPCQHNLCRKCANDVFQNRGTPMGSGGRFRCPTCRYEVVLDRHGVYGLQRNLLVENIIDMYQTEGRKPSFHKVETLMCEDHEEEKVNIYCLTCQKPTCSLCKVFGQHQECEVSPMEKVCKDQKKEMSDAIAMLVSGNDRLQAIISQTEELGKMAETNGRKTKSDLCESFDKLYAVLEDRKNRMMAKITADVQERNQVLQEMLKNYGQQLEGSSKLMEASLALMEERGVPQFLKVSREMIGKLLITAKSSEVRKPPFNIHNMDEFKVNFQSHEAVLYQLDFIGDKSGPSSAAHVEEDSLLREQLAKSSTQNIDTDSEVEVEADHNVDDDVADSDDTATTSATSRSAVSSHDERRETTSGRHSGALVGANEADSRRSASDDPTIKKGRWYDMYVKQLPAPISMSGFSAPMESSVHMKVVVPASALEANDVEEEDLKQRSATPSNLSSSCDTDERDREIEELLAPRRRRWISRLTLQPSPEGSFDYSPRSSPVSFRRYRVREVSPVNMSPSTSPSPGSPLSLRRHRSTHNHSPVESRRSQLRRDISPSRRARNRRRGSDTPPNTNEPQLSVTSGTRANQGRSNSPTSQQTRRPRLYCSHRRRTWSHLLDKR